MAQALLSLGSNIDPEANLRAAAARRKRLRREARMRQANSAPVCKPNEEPAAAPPRRRRRRACRKAPQKPSLRHLRKRMTIECARYTACQAAESGRASSPTVSPVARKGRLNLLCSSSGLHGPGRREAAGHCRTPRQSGGQGECGPAGGASCSHRTSRLPHGNGEQRGRWPYAASAVAHVEVDERGKVVRFPPFVLTSQGPWMGKLFGK